MNVPKCEIFSTHNVSPFPPEMKRSTHPNIVILGIPIGDKAFCSSFISEKHEEAKALLLKLEEMSAVDPHVAFSLLRQCASWPTLLAAHHPPKPCQPLRPLIMTCGQPLPSAQQLTGLAASRAQLRQGWPGHALPESAFPSSIHRLSELLWCWSIVPRTPYPCSPTK